MTKKKDHLRLGSALIEAAIAGNIDEVKRLVEEDSMPVDTIPFCQSALLVAAQAGKVEVIKYLITKGADVEFKNAWGETPLKMAEDFGREEAAKIIKSAILLKNF